MTSAQASLGFLASKRIACSLVRVLGSVSIGSDGIVVPLLGKNAHCSIANSMCQRKSLSCKNLCSIILQHREKYYKKRLLFCNGFFLAGFLGLGRATAFAVLSLSLNPFVVLSPALRGHPPALPSKLDGGGIFLLFQIFGFSSLKYYALTG